jgi:membrane-bound ClpP family serine protease
MSAIVLLFVIGLILLGFEVFVPGAILGIFGGLALLGGSVLAFLNYGPGGGLLALGLALALVGVLLYVELKILPKTTLGRRLFLHAAVSARSTTAPVLSEIVGQLAVASTPLSPSGYVQIDGKRYEAYSQSGYVAAGTTLKVVSADNFRLIVTQA